MGDGVNSLRAGLLAALTCLTFALLSAPAAAQKGPTQTNEPVVDEFGLDRKSGRLSWSSHEIIKIGNGDSSLGIVVNGIGNRGWQTGSLPGDNPLISIARPELSSFAMPDYTSSIPGAVSPNLIKVTVSYFGGSETFECTFICLSEYFTDSTLESITNGSLFTDKHGIKIYFYSGVTKVVYPDGRELNYETNKFEKNNFGYMLKYSTGINIQAVNQAVDYCSENNSSPCSSLSAVRSASIVTQGINPGTTALTDSVGGVTTMRWATITAKKSPRPLGAPVSVLIPNITERYLMGVTLPGDTAETITLTYNSIDPAINTHDDIRVVSIARPDVTANYEYVVQYPYGAEEWNASVHGGQLPPSLIEYPLPGNSFQGSYTLQTTMKINGQVENQSLAEKPEGTFGRTRRRLLSLTDGLDRISNFHYDGLEDFAGTISPESNEVYNEYGDRYNIIKTIVKAKAGSGLPNLETSYSYPTDCALVTKATCNKPLSVTDPKGNVTEYTYNPLGQVLTETKPAPSVGAPRPKVTNTYTIRTAFIKDATSAVVAAGPPISLLTQSSTCNTLASCGGTTDEVVTVYDYGPTTGLNNLNLRGTTVTAVNAAGQMETLRTCYQYNYFGEKIAETQPKGTGSVCP
jgi:YD repeat-containing protein